jgi:hypothetical protein
MSPKKWHFGEIMQELFLPIRIYKFLKSNSLVVDSGFTFFVVRHLKQVIVNSKISFLYRDHNELGEVAMKKTVLVVMSLAFLWIAFVTSKNAYAIPAWARKYKTSCATCHASFPKLNAFGRSFLNNGYQFPGGAEEDKDQVREETVSMGSEAYKRVWPDAIWPNILPAGVPLAVIIEAETAYDPNAPEGEPKITFDDIPGEVEILTGGNFGDNISFFGELEIKGGEAELEMAHISFDNILPNNGLSLKIGKMVPYVTPFSNMRRLTMPYWYATRPLGSNQWNFDRAQQGFEIRGLLSQARLVYSAGLVEGRNNLSNGDKDFYFHAGYKWGGLQLNGVREATGAGASKPWEDNSVRLDGFFYSGRATLAGGQKDDFTQIGGSLDVYINRWNLSALVAVQNDDRPVVGTNVDGTGTHFMVEGTYVLYPWLLPNLRYERFKATLGDQSETEQRFVPGVVALIRANVKALIATEIEKAPGGSFDLGEIEFALAFGF